MALLFWSKTSDPSHHAGALLRPHHCRARHFLREPSIIIGCLRLTQPLPAHTSAAPAAIVVPVQRRKVPPAAPRRTPDPPDPTRSGCAEDLLREDSLEVP